MVASRVGGNPELVQDGETGLLFRSGDAADLAAQLRRLIEDEQLRQRLAARAHAFIHEKFSLAASTRRMSAIYSETVGQASGLS